MSYITPAQLVDGPGRLTELAELFVVDEALLRATIDETSRAAWSAPEIAVADAALATIVAEALQADAEIDARLAMRGYTLPQDPVQFPILVSWARAITRYHLHSQRERTDVTAHRIERDYTNALKSLDLVADGKLSLGAGDTIAPPTPAGGGGPLAVAPTRVFDRCSLADY